MLGVSGPRLSRLERLTDEVISFSAPQNQDGEYMASQVVLVKINLSNDLPRILHMNFIFIAGGGYFRTQQSFCKLQGIGPSSLRDAHAEGAIGKTQFPQSSESIAFHLPSSSISFSYYDQSSSLPPSTYNLLPFPCRSMSKEYKNF